MQNSVDAAAFGPITGIVSSGYRDWKVSDMINRTTGVHPSSGSMFTSYALQCSSDQMNLDLTPGAVLSFSLPWIESSSAILNAANRLIPAKQTGMYGFRRS